MMIALPIKRVKRLNLSSINTCKSPHCPFSFNLYVLPHIDEGKRWNVIPLSLQNILCFMRDVVLSAVEFGELLSRVLVLLVIQTEKRFYFLGSIIASEHDNVHGTCALGAEMLLWY